MKQVPRHYYILFQGEYFDQRWARSEAEAVKNCWWDTVKNRDKFTERTLDPSDFEAISHTA